MNVTLAPLYCYWQIIRITFSFIYTVYSMIYKQEEKFDLLYKDKRCIPCLEFFIGK